MDIYTKKTIEKSPYTSYILVPPLCVHASTFFVISIVERGEATVDLYSKNSKDSNIKKTEYLKESHCLISFPFSKSHYTDSTKNLAFRNIYMDESEFEECCNFVDPKLYNELCSLEYAPTFKLSSPAVIFYAEQMTFLVGEEKTTNKDMILKSLVCSILAQYVKCKTEAHIFPNWINALLRNLDDEEFISLSVEQMVQTTNYSHGYVNREFKKYLGCSIKQFVIRKKLSLATVMLATTTLSTQEIADNLNFSTVSNFINFFKIRYNITPAKYRKNYGSAITTESYQEWGDIVR